MKSNPKKQREAYRLIRDIKNLLANMTDETPVLMLKKKLKGCTGYTDYETIRFAIFSELVPTIIHEAIHIIRFSWSETKVKKAESLVRHYIKMKDVVIILRLFVEHFD
jgi:hypothetical protein